MALDVDDGRAQLSQLANEVFGTGVWDTESPSRSLSSVDLMRFLVRIERLFGISVPDDDLRSENFISFQAVLDMVNRNRK